MNKKVVVIGGGASGLMASVAAAENGALVTLLEPNDKLGKKLNITGKGRCNVTNNASNQDLISNIPTNGKFLYSAFSKFNAQDTINFFERENVPLKTERGNRVFPVSDSAFDITDALKRKIYQLNISCICDRAVDICIKNQSISSVVGEKNNYECDAVILATGGVSYPGTGSTGDGYHMAEKLGHTIMPLHGSLIPLESTDTCCARMQGLALKNIDFKVFDHKKIVYSDFGELLFTHFGISGPLVLSASSHMHHVDFLDCIGEIDLKPALDEIKLEDRILREFSSNPNKELTSVLHGLLPSSMIPVFLEKNRLNGFTKCCSVSKEMRKKIIFGLKHFTFSISGFRPICEAIVTSGGVKISEINPNSMESKLIKGLFFAGEIIDVDAYTGGFNLQIAWSTGHLAGISASI